MEEEKRSIWPWIVLVVLFLLAFLALIGPIEEDFQRMNPHIEHNK